MVSGGVMFIVFFYLLYSRLADAPPPISHPSGGHNDKAAAAERPVEASIGTAGT